MAAHFPIRAVENGFDAFHRTNEHAFHDSPPSPRHRAEMLDRLELDRTLAAFDGATPVASAGAWSFRMSVPGALAEAAGVTWIAVMPSHRRRGILTSLMRRQIDDIHERGEPIAVLWASDARIYGRFGYGRAVLALELHDPARRGRAELPGARGRRTAAADHRAAGGPGRAGQGLRHAAAHPAGLLHQEQFLVEPHRGGPGRGRPGSAPLRCVLAEDDTGPRGYALYSGRGRWDEDTFLPDAALDIRELAATDPAATAALWSDLLSRDLVSEVTARLRPVDDPLLHLLADARRARPQVSDGLWVRIIDVPGALTARRYAAPLRHGHRGHRRDMPVERGPVGGCAAPAPCWQAPGPARGPARQNASGPPRRAGRHPARGQRWGRPFCGGTPLGTLGGRPGHRGAQRRSRGAVGRAVLGPGPLVPHDLLAGG